jgi:LysM repeat protein
MARTATLLVIGLALVAAACGGDDSEEATPTATPGSGVIASATPFATLPTTTILDGGRGVSGEATPAPDVTYVVAAGDVLGLIAERFETTVEAIQALNELTDTHIFVGQELVIPGENGSTATPQPTPSTPGSTREYVVVSGDSGFAIALEFGVTLEELAVANGLSVDQLGVLQVGQTLLIPTP